jgi:hypothetical protein
VAKGDYKFNKVKIDKAIQSSNRESMKDRIHKDIEKKIDEILKKGKKSDSNDKESWKSYTHGESKEEGKQEVSKEDSLLVENPSASGTSLVVKTKEEEDEQRLKKIAKNRRIMRAAGMLDDTTILRDRTELEEKEMVIHQAGVYTEARNIVTKKSYDIRQLKQVFGAAWEDVSDDFENVYDENQLLRFHDTLRVDGDVSKAILKSNRFIIGTDYPDLILDTNRSYPSPESESYELRRINNNFVFWSIANELRRIDKNVNTYNAMNTQMYQSRGYQRGVILVERDQYGCPIALKPLSALRCGRVFVNINTWRLMGLEYFDFKKPDNIILAEDLIYMVNRDYAQSIASMMYGYSDLEFVTHLVELNLIINSIVLKEINRTHWAPYVFIQLQDTEDEETAADFMAKAKRGLALVSLLPFKVDHIPPTTSGAFVVEQRDMNSRSIVSHMGIPYDLVSEDKTQTHANLSTRLQAYNQTDVKFYRLLIRQVWEYQWYARNIMAIIKRRYQKLLNSENPVTSDSNILRNSESQNYVDPATPDVANSVTSPGEITIRESQNLYSEAENDAIIEDERRIWEVNRQLQVSKVKALIETQISEKGVPIDDAQRREIYDSVGMAYLMDDDKSAPKVTTEQYFSKKGYDNKPFDLASELGIDMISPSDREFEKRQLEELMKFTDYSRLPFKVKLTFPMVSFDTDIETALYTIGLKEAEIIPVERAQEKTGNEDLIEQTKQETQIKLFMAKALSQVMNDVMMQQEERQMQMGQKFGFAPQGFKKPPMGSQQEQQSKSGNQNQLDLKNRTNVATRLAKKSPLGNATR